MNIDSTIPNLALKKIQKFHIDRGDEVRWNVRASGYTPDKTYVSCVFDWNRHKCAEWEGKAEIGGGGYDLRKTLPPESNYFFDACSYAKAAEQKRNMPTLFGALAFGEEADIPMLQLVE